MVSEQAIAATQEWQNKARGAVSTLCDEADLTYDEALDWLAKQMGLHTSHINFDRLCVTQCRRVLALVEMRGVLRHGSLR